MEHKSAFIAVMGSPNVGKSTLINRIVGEKVSIVSDKAQTTRSRIAGICSTPDDQMVFLDTPGVQNPKNKLGEYMVRTAFGALEDVDAALLMVDATHGVGPRDEALIQRLIPGSIPVLAAVNKADEVIKEKLDAAVQKLKELGVPADHIHVISAKTGAGVPELYAALRAYLKPGPRYYPDDEYTDQSERMMASEIIREKALLLLREEVPHGVGVLIERMEPRQGAEIVDVEAALLCEREGHKGIIIGRGGGMLRRIGTEARRDLEKLLGAKVYLKLFVRVEENWRDSVRVMKELGYQ
jgi:GTP-binding protein Era